MVNVMKVDGLGIFLMSGVNSPRGGKLRNPFSRRVERKRGGDVSRSTPIASVGPLDQIYLPREGRIGSLGSGHKVRDASELGESQRVLSSVHRVHVSDTVGQGVRSVTVGPLDSSESLGSVHMTDGTRVLPRRELILSGEQRRDCSHRLQTSVLTNRKMSVKS